MMRLVLLAPLLCLLFWNGVAHSQDIIGTIDEEYGVQSQFVLKDSKTGDLKTILVPPTLRCKTGLKGQFLNDLSQLPKGTLVRVDLEPDGKTAREIQELYSWHIVPAQWLDEQLSDFKTLFAPGNLFRNKQMLLGFISVVLVSLICGAISSLVLSNRMAFFSDALAHFAFAGVALGILMNLAGWLSGDDMIVPVMVIFGIITGCGIAYVKQKTVLANDTIIGVFFAGAMGLGAILLTAVTKIGGGGRGAQNPETFLFGDPMATTSQQIVYLLILLILTLLFLVFRYNSMVLSSFNGSLARSRRISVQLGNYLFIIFLAMTVNACLKVVGALLINALLILPAATAGNVSRTLRQFFWLSLLTSIIAGLGGFLLSATWQPVVSGKALPLASGGVIVLIGTLCFFMSMLLGPWLRGRRAVSTTNA